MQDARAHFSAEENQIIRLFQSEGIEFFASTDVENAVVAIPRLMPTGTKSVTVFLIPYYVKDTTDNRNVARFAASLDYHLYGNMLSEKLSEAFGNIGSHYFVKVMCDHSPLDEKACAAMLGLGTLGKNRVIINPKYGSYVFIGAVLTSATVNISSVSSACEDSTAKNDKIRQSPNRKCNNCGLCIKSCPTFLNGKGECLSALTQKRNLTDGELSLIAFQKCKWGCDICQDVCPANKGVPETPIEFFRQNRLPHVTPDDILSMPDGDFAMRAYGWRKKPTILRNLTAKTQNKA